MPSRPIPSMPTSVFDAEVGDAFERARSKALNPVRVGRRTIRVASPFPSPEDWRDRWIYFLLIDRFNNPAVPPRSVPYNAQCSVFQGGTFDGVRRQLDYLQRLGVGAIWLSPVLKNCQYNPFTYHGYGIQDFLRIEPRFCRVRSRSSRRKEDLSAAANGPVWSMIPCPSQLKPRRRFFMNANRISEAFWRRTARVSGISKATAARHCGP